jgi:hypothetical protein
MEGMQLKVFTNNIYSKWIILVSSCYMNEDQCRYSSVAKCANVKPEDDTCVLQVAPTWSMAVDRAQPQRDFSMFVNIRLHGA